MSTDTMNARRSALIPLVLARADSAGTAQRPPGTTHVTGPATSIVVDVTE